MLQPGYMYPELPIPQGGAGGKLFYFDLNVETGVQKYAYQIAYRTDTIRFADMFVKS